MWFSIYSTPQTHVGAESTPHDILQTAMVWYLGDFLPIDRSAKNMVWLIAMKIDCRVFFSMFSTSNST